MKALLMREYRSLEVADMPVPGYGPDDLLVRVKACGICGSDVHGYDGSTGRRLPPIVMGHEAAGVVEAVGANVKNFAAGDRVTFDSTVSCGCCKFCCRGQINLCDNRQVLGVSTPDFRRHGAFAEYVTVPARISYKLPESVPFEHAAMIEAISVAVHGVGRLPLRLGDSAVVVGSGMIGLLVVQVLRNSGAGKIIAVDLEDNKLELAKQLGADYAFNPKRDDITKEVLALTDGTGADCAVDAVGATSPIKACLGAIRKGGSVSLIGNITPQVELPLQVVVTREITLYGSCASNGEYPQCIDLLARGAIQVDPIISAKAPLLEGPSWFERLYGKEAGLMKVIIQP
ncbi:MAG: galactitol-1-phosphate 5-dehydrogenase [Bryobacterales bacterium]|nr:galactitol-1-phosphate 5-dehydrogenase [Bryobacterales bacterium]